MAHTKPIQRKVSAIVTGYFVDLIIDKLLLVIVKLYIEIDMSEMILKKGDYLFKKVSPLLSPKANSFRVVVSSIASSSSLTAAYL